MALWICSPLFTTLFVELCWTHFHWKLFSVCWLWGSLRKKNKEAMDWVNRLLTNKTQDRFAFCKMFYGYNPKDFSCSGPNLIIIRLYELHLCSQDAFTRLDYNRVKFILNKKKAFWSGVLKDACGLWTGTLVNWWKCFFVCTLSVWEMLFHRYMCVNRALCLGHELQIDA